ncbi:MULTISPECIES: L-lactate dehydrogenase [unclassified Enterococcus]|uniref:lactate/malate family dehydrogenase n=1 Tax=unclassified Enterococcus TaxID=2608891 RepID=UPI001555F561|nr:MULTISPECIES: L-lactate dehydrogenase [unclassified Enterococcus]MBS7577076.1 L-lactate dehydrogenase [Enterococcus sp. MMGLQ5-2]MBS7584477.1 L-lactate dehydrogenase [Enterococcus sp. MMGLQ5-1]NPD12332.1 L-lactate dehydrogenase [Enterococcus sp. MMGLQ5-1]NPD36910.1 L-lactate dehydrogenase [Enterococcus sp. MMGLQ5-2]
MRIGIIGLGHVGSTIAYTLLLKKIANELVLIDNNQAKVAAETIELLDTALNIKHKINILTHYQDLESADFIIFSAGDITIFENAESDRLAELKVTAKIVEDVAPKLKESGFSGKIISITNPCDVIALYLAELTGLPKEQVIGTGTVIDTDRLINITKRRDVMMIGEHGNSQVAVNQVSNSEESAGRAAGWQIYQAKRHTAFGIASTTFRIIQAMTEKNNEVLNVSCYDSTKDCYYGWPSLFDGEKFVRQELELTAEENIKFIKSIETIKQNYQSIQSL